MVKTGISYELIHAGAHAMDIMRTEKMYLHWGHDISPAENPFEAGLEFAVRLKKEEDFQPCREMCEDRVEFLCSDAFPE